MGHGYPTCPLCGNVYDMSLPCPPPKVATAS